MFHLASLRSQKATLFLASIVPSCTEGDPHDTLRTILMAIRHEAQQECPLKASFDSFSTIGRRARAATGSAQGMCAKEFSIRPANAIHAM